MVFPLGDFFLTRDHSGTRTTRQLHFSACKGIHDICNLGIEMMYKSLTENIERSGVEEKVLMNVSPEFSVMYHLQTTSV